MHGQIGLQRPVAHDRHERDHPRRDGRGLTTGVSFYTIDPSKGKPPLIPSPLEREGEDGGEEGGGEGVASKMWGLWRIAKICHGMILKQLACPVEPLLVAARQVGHAVVVVGDAYDHG